MFDLLYDPATTDVAEFLGIAEDDLAVRDDFQRPDHRWLAAKDGTAIGLATAFVRPDDRMFLTHRLDDEAAFEPLLNAALAGIDRPVFVTIRNSQPERLQSALAAGFTEELRARSYTVPFEPTLRRLERAPSSRFDIVSVGEVGRDELFDLDTRLRSDVPGSDGWRGRRMWFDDELASPECDPNAYVVGRDPATHDLVGLCRFWRNRGGPTLGMLGVLPRCRNGRLAVLLLRSAAAAASTWGFDQFTAHTARSALQRRMVALGAEEVDGFVRLVRNPGTPTC